MSVMHVRWSHLLLLTFLSFFFLASGCVSTQNGATGSAKMESNALTVKGRVKDISLRDGVLVVAPPKGDRVTIQINDQTPVNGGVIQEVVKNIPVRVTYTVEKKKNVAVSIEILPQGSCG